MYKAEGLVLPDSIAQATDNYIGEQDVFQMFVEEYYEQDDNSREKTADVFTKYESWCKAVGEQAVSRRKFCIEMKRLGISHEKVGSKTYYGLCHKRAA